MNWDFAKLSKKAFKIFFLIAVLIVIAKFALPVDRSTFQSNNDVAEADQKFKTTSTNALKIVGYYPEWAIYRKPSFYPRDIDASLLTHINYAFAKTDAKGNVTLFDEWAATGYRDDWRTEKSFWGNFRQLYDLKQKHPKLQILISIGGWTLSDPFSVMAADPVARQNFIRSSIEFCDKYHLDGIDIDWEYPGFAEHSGRPEDTLNFTLLLSELYADAKKHNPPLLLTIAAPAGDQKNNVEIHEIHKYLDWINVMTYDFHGPWSSDPITNHNAPLYSPEQGDPQLCVDAAIHHYISHGVPLEKIVLGIAFYGRTYAKANSTPTGLFSTYSGPGSHTEGADPGMRFFSDIKRNLASEPAYKRYWDIHAQVPYLYNPATFDFISYDDEESMEIKVHYIKAHNLGGAMIWELGLDTYPTWDGMYVINRGLNSK